MQFDTTINRWHTAANTGRINGSNPCFTGDTLCAHRQGTDPVRRSCSTAPTAGEEFGVYTHDVTNPGRTGVARSTLTTPEAFMITGQQPDRAAALRQWHGAALHAGPQASSRRTAATSRPQDLSVRRSGPHARSGQHRRSTRTGRSRCLPTADAHIAKLATTPTRLRLPDDVDGRVRPLPRLARRRRHRPPERPRRRSTARPTIAPRSCPRHQELLDAGSTAAGRSSVVRAGQRHRAAPAQRRRQFKQLPRSARRRVGDRRAQVVFLGRSSRRRPKSVAAFLRGLFDADGCRRQQVEGHATSGSVRSRSNCCAARSACSSTFGISSRDLPTCTAAETFDAHRGRDGSRTALPATAELRPPHHGRSHRALRSDRSASAVSAKRTGLPRSSRAPSTWLLRRRHDGRG